MFLLYQTSYANCLIYNNNKNSSNLEENIDYNIKKGKNCKVLRSLELRPSKFIGSLLINCTFNPNTDISSEYRDGLASSTENIKISDEGTLTLSCKEGYKLSNPSKNTVTCNKGILAIDFEGCICSGSQTFNYTGSYQTFNIPDCATELKLEVWGAQGGGSNGGKGGYSYGTFSSQSIDTDKLYIYIGGNGSLVTGGWNGGGKGSSNSITSYGGGGGTDIRTTVNNNYQNRIIVAGGGGGASASDAVKGGYGGGGNNNGGDGTGKWKGTGGTQTAGGIEGDTSDPNYTATNGSFGVGGIGGYKSLTSGGGGGGGGGGWYGGGGGDWSAYNQNRSGGGGGSGYIGGVTNGGGKSGVRSGNGMVIICWGNNTDCD